MLIEQAVFTSAQTARRDGYQLVATSPGLLEADARELSLWCPSHRALHDESPGSRSINFHGLPSGAFCISQTTPAGGEYSGREGARLHTHCLIAPPQVMLRFANNPFAVIKAALAGGHVDDCGEVPKNIKAFPLVGRASPVDTALVEGLLTECGTLLLAGLVPAAINSTSLALVNTENPERLIAAIFSCVPVERRSELTFSTGLKYSPRRPFRLIVLDETDPHAQQRLCRRHGLTLHDCRAAGSEQTSGRK